MLSFKEMYESYAPDVYRFSLWLSGSSFWASEPGLITAPFGPKH